MRAALSAADTLLMDGNCDMVNMVLGELLARTAYSRERAFSNVFKEEDWKKPRNAPKDWVTKVKYSELKDWDPRYTESTVLALPAAEEEVRKELDRKATLAKAQTKLDALEPATDFLNSQPTQG